MVEKAKVVYVFGEFSLDPGERSFKKNGKTIHLPAKEFDTLLYFLANEGRDLPKDEMMSAIWQDTFVEEGNLAQYVSRLRKLLGSDGNNYIHTLPKKGYRFEGEVAVLNARPADRGRTFWWLASGLGFLLLLAGLAWWTRPTDHARSTNTADISKPAALTDGKQDDGAVQWTSDNHIRFFRRISPARVEAWIMSLDGSDQHREVPPIKDFLNGMWSPDGKKIFFMKDGDTKTSYLANADGTGEIALPMLVGNSDWSPDRTRFVYETKLEEGNTEIFLYTLATHQNVNLTHNKEFDADPSFAPDGEHIAFVSVRDGNPEIYLMDATGEHVRRLTDHPAFDHFPAISPDGTQLLFSSNRDGNESQFYVQDLDDTSPPVRISDLVGIEGAHEKCWSPDGTRLAFSATIAGKDQVFVMDVEPFRPKPVVSDSEAELQFPRVSPDGKKLLLQARLADRSIELRIADVGTKSVRTIYRTEPDLPATFMLDGEWSPDGGTIVFSDRVSGNVDLYTIRADGQQRRRITDDAMPDTEPVYSPDGKYVYFLRDNYGRGAIHRVDADGANDQTVTNKQGYEMSPAVSPDGKTLIYSADRQDGRKTGLDLYAAPLDSTVGERVLLARASHDVNAVYSNDGSRIAFVANSDDNPEIYLANSDGSGLVRITRNKANDGTPTFSHEGDQIFFSSDRNGRCAIFEVDLPAR